MKSPSKEKIKKKMERELERITLIEDILNELGAKNTAGGPISIAKEHYIRESAERLAWLCKYHTFDTDMNRQMANRLAMMERLRYDAFRHVGFTKKDALALCISYYE